MKIVNRLMLALFNFVTNLSLAYHFEDLQKSRLAKHSDSNDKVHTLILIAKRSGKVIKN